VSTNHPADIGFAYRRFLVNQLRKAYGFEGTPIRLVFRAHRQKNRGGGRGAGPAVRRSGKSAP
jgi:predicted GTPase